MTEKRTLAVIVEIETNDPRLDPAVLDNIGIDPSLAARARRAVLQHLPRNVIRVVATMPVPMLKHMMMLHEVIGDRITGGETAVRPHPDYVPPTRD